MAPAQNNGHKQKLPRGRPFQKGQVANPGGRPKEIRDVVAAARQHTTMAIERLVYWAKSDNPRASPLAAVALLDRGWGKAAQIISISDAPDALSDSQLAMIIENGVAVLEAEEIEE